MFLRVGMGSEFVSGLRCATHDVNMFINSIHKIRDHNRILILEMRERVFCRNFVGQRCLSCTGSWKKSLDNNAIQADYVNNAEIFS